MEEHKWWVVGPQRTFRAMKIFCMVLWWWIHIIIHLSKLYRMYRTNFHLGAVHNVNYRLWVIIICQCSFISYTKTCVGNVDNEQGYVPVASLVTQTGKNLLAMWEVWVRFLGWDDPLEKGKATHSSILAWRVPWTEEPGGLQSMEFHRAGHNWATNTFTLCKCEDKRYIVMSIFPSNFSMKLKLFQEIKK